MAPENHFEVGRMQQSLATTPNADEKALKISPQKPKPGEPSFTVGFPSVTTDRVKKASAPDSDGGLRVAIGKTLSLNETYSRQGQDFSLLSSKLRNFFEAAHVVTDADGICGLSGGPMLNSMGEVVGIYTSGWPDIAEYDPKRTSIGVSILRLLK